MTDGLMLIHAFPMDARMWEPQVTEFGQGIPVITPNLPGFGGTPGVGPVMSMGAAAAACLQVADATGGKVFDSRSTSLSEVFKEIRGYQ